MKKQSKSTMLKKQLMSAVSMMLAAAVALGSSTYAWFVNRSRAEVKNVLFQASTGKNLEIAGAVAETGNAAALGLTAGEQVPQGKADQLTYYSSATPELLGVNSFTYPNYDASTPTGLYMTPLSIDGADLKITPGATTFFMNNEWDAVSQRSSSDTTIVGGYNTYTEVVGNTEENEKYICAQVYFRASEAMDVYLNQEEWANYIGINDAKTTVSYPFITQFMPSGATDEEKAAYLRQANDLAKALRIGFVVDGETDPIVACFAESTETFSTALWNTSKDGANITSDTPVKAIDGTTKEITSFGTAVTDDLTDYTLTGASSGTGSDPQQPAITGKTKLFHLDANTPKRVTIYIWLEGTDKECVNAISANIAGVYLPFVGGTAIDGDSDHVNTYSFESEVVDLAPAAGEETVE